MLLQAKNISLAFQGNTVLDDVSFAVEKGDYIGLIGPNGAGKTTLLKVLLGIIKPDHGKVITNSSVKIGYVPQNFFSVNNTFPVSVEEVLSMGTNSFGLFVKIKEKNHMKSKLDQVGLDESFLSKNFQSLSGGQKQRVIIARALLENPDILMFDEPVANVDATAKKQIYELFADLNTKYGVSILFVSHEIEHITKACNKVLCLNKHLHPYCHPLDFVDNACKQNAKPTLEAELPVHHHHDHCHE